MLICPLIEEFLEWHVDRSERSAHTRKAYACDLSQFAKFAGERDIADLSESDCEEWLSSLKRNGLVASTRRRKIASVKCFFKYCVRRSLLTSTPLRDLQVPSDRRRDLPRSLTLEDARRLVDHVRHDTKDLACGVDDRGLSRFKALRDRAVVELLLATGLRVGELTSLSVSDIDTCSWALSVLGKGRRKRMAFLVDKQSQEAVAQYLSCRETVQGCDGPLFLNLRGGRLSEQGVAYLLRRRACMAKITRHITPHMLRHTAATYLLQSGADIRIVQEFLGHASISMTQRYVHVSNEHLRSSLEQHHHSRLYATSC